MTILIVEDDCDIGALLQRGFGGEGYQVKLAQDGECALRLAREAGDLRAIILDIMLPDTSGLDVCRALRNAGQDAPIIMLSARSSVAERTEGLLAGADDYVVMPFAFEESLARVRVQEQRRHAHQENSARLVVGEFQLDLESRLLERGSKRLRLTEREADLLALLMRNADRPVARADIFSALWAGQGGASLNVVDVYIGYLRHKIGETFPSVGRIIVTVRSRGFMFVNVDLKKSTPNLTD